MCTGSSMLKCRTLLPRAGKAHLEMLQPCFWVEVYMRGFWRKPPGTRPSGKRP